MNEHQTQIFLSLFVYVGVTDTHPNMKHERESVYIHWQLVVCECVEFSHFPAHVKFSKCDDYKKRAILKVWLCSINVCEKYRKVAYMHVSVHIIFVSALTFMGDKWIYFAYIASLHIQTFPCKKSLMIGFFTVFSLVTVIL